MSNLISNTIVFSTFRKHLVVAAKKSLLPFKITLRILEVSSETFPLFLAQNDMLSAVLEIIKQTINEEKCMILEKLT